MTETREIDRDGMPATLFIRPHGRQREFVIHNIYREDADYLKKESIKVSMEETERFNIIYLDFGREIEGEPDEYVQICGHKTRCEDEFAKAVTKVKQLKKEMESKQ